MGDAPHARTIDGMDIPPPPLKARKAPVGESSLGVVVGALVAWSALTVAGSMRGTGAGMLAAQLAAAAIVWLISLRAPTPGTLRSLRPGGIHAGIGAGIVLSGAAYTAALISGGVEVGGSVLGEVSTDMLWFLMVACLGAPLSEEMMFRQVLSRQLEIMRGPILGSLMASAAFAAAHPEAASTPGGAVLLLTSGMMLSYLRRRYGILCSVAAHSAYNCTLILMTAYLM